MKQLETGQQQTVNKDAAEAYEKYHTMRLSAIIFVLRDNYKIETQMQEKETVYGTVRFAKYVYKGIKK